MSWLTNICVERPVFTWVLMLLTVAVGTFSFFSLGLDKYPNVDVPAISATIELRGASPQEVETQISDKIEAAVNTIGGLEELRSTSSEGVAQLVMTFDLHKNADVAAQEVRDHINDIMGTLPKDIEQPRIAKFDPSSVPILYLMLKGTSDMRSETELADKVIRRRLESVGGVGQVSLAGGTKREIKVTIDPARLEAYSLTAADVREEISRQNFSLPGGSFERGPSSVTLHVEGKFSTIDQLRRLILKGSSTYTTRLEDVATIDDATEDTRSWASYDGDRAVVFSVRKQAGANTVEVVDAVKGRLDEIRKELPEGQKLEIVRDNSASIRTSVAAVEEHLVLGAIFASLIVFLFLGSGRSALIAALAIPVSVVGAFAVMYLLGFTLNMMTLLALALAVGIVIDDAIVVLENIHRYIVEHKQAPPRAAVVGTAEIALAVLATTLSLLAVFVPVGFMGGIVGRFLQSFGLAMAAAIAVSMFVSFTLTPMLCARWLSEQPHNQLNLSERLIQAIYSPIERCYLGALHLVMKRRWMAVIACLVALGAILPLARAVPLSFMAEDDSAQFGVTIRLPEGSSLEATQLHVDRVAKQIREVPGVVHTLVTIGDNAEKTQNSANIHVALSDPELRSVSQSELIDQVRNGILAHLPRQWDVSAAPVSDFGASGGAVQYALQGSDSNVLGAYAQRVQGLLKEVPDAVDVSTSMKLGSPQVDIVIDRERSSALGVAPYDIASTIQLLVGGLKVSSFTDKGDDYDIRVRASRAYRVDERALAIHVPSRSAGSVPLDSVIRLQQGSGPSKIERLNRRRQVTVSCNVRAGVGESVVSAALAKIIQDLALPPGYTATAVGNSKETGKAAIAFLMAFGASFLFMYLILAAQFESWLHPVTILICLPLTLPFALLSLLIFKQQLSIISCLGVLVLFGVVKKNSILQIDHILHLRSIGLQRTEAVLQANRDRLRPILMTTIAFVAGMMPLLFAKGVGSGLSRGIAGVVVGGQTFSLLLTLLATPVLYTLFDDFSIWLNRSNRKP